jgi:ribose transport system permease protein
MTAASNGVSPSKSAFNFTEFLEKYALIGVWLAIIIVFSLIEPDTFFTTRNFRIIFGSQTVLLVLTLGLVVSLAVSEFDLSIGAMMAFAYQTTVVLDASLGWPIGLAILTVLVAGLAFGLLNSLAIVGIGVHSIIATLATGTLLTGFVQLITDNKIITGVSPDLIGAINTRFLGLPLISYYGLGICLALWYALQHTPIGRYLYFVGQGKEVARLAGVNVQAVRVGALVTTALAATIAGIMLAGVRGSSTPENGAVWLLPAYAAAFLGATSINPGRFNAWGAFVAVYFLVTGFTGLQLAGLSSWVQDVFNGAVLLVAVALSQIAQQRNAGSG